MSDTSIFAPDAGWALHADAIDPLASFRDEFLIPPHGDDEQVYLCGNSLGLQPRGVRAASTRSWTTGRGWVSRATNDGRHPWLRLSRVRARTAAPSWSARSRAKSWR